MNRQEEYFEWLCDLIQSHRYVDIMSFDRLLRFLHATDFTYTILKDGNREGDGIDLRYRFIYENDYDYTSTIQLLDNGRPCSVFEMMVALSLRCEETIMDDPGIGNRIGQWFWGMIVNLGLGGMTDDCFDEEKASYIIDRFLRRKYEPDGRGGLFTIKNIDRDLRKVEIWYQLCWYLDTLD